MPRCCVPDCFNTEKTQPLKTFHRFPLDSKRRQIWIDCLYLDKKVTNALRICSDHFQLSDFHSKIFGDQDSPISLYSRTILKKTAEPFRCSAQRKKNLPLLVNESLPKSSSLQITGKWIETEHNYALDNKTIPLDQQPVSNDSQATYLSLQMKGKQIEMEHNNASHLAYPLIIQPVFNDSLPICTALQMMGKWIETEHNYALNWTILPQDIQLVPLSNEAQPTCLSLQMKGKQIEMEHNNASHLAFPLNIQPVLNESQPMYSFTNDVIYFNYTKRESDSDHLEESGLDSIDDEETWDLISTSDSSDVENVSFDPSLNNLNSSI